MIREDDLTLVLAKRRNFIREDDLTLVLAKRRNFIGVRPLWDSILIFITGLFYIPAAVAIPNEICRWIMLGFGVLVTGYGIVEICGRRFTTDKFVQGDSRNEHH